MQLVMQGLIISSEQIYQFIRKHNTLYYPKKPVLARNGGSTGPENDYRIYKKVLTIAFSIRFGDISLERHSDSLIVGPYLS